MKIIAALACRNNSTRLYGKPLQRLGRETVLNYIVKLLKKRKEIHEIVLAISESSGNEPFVKYANEVGLKYVVGSDTDVLKRLIDACDLAGGDQVFRMTTECPFPYLEGLTEAVKSHVQNSADYTTYSKLADGGAFELISLEALKLSHQRGSGKHRSEYCTLYINENKENFKTNVIEPKSSHQRPKFRLTIDFPEDLILCRKIIAHFGEEKYIGYDELMPFLDSHPELTSLVDNLTDANYVKFYY